MFEWANGRMTPHHPCPLNPVTFTYGFLSVAKSVASFQNPPQAMKMISKAMVELVILL